MTDHITVPREVLERIVVEIETCNCPVPANGVTEFPYLTRRCIEDDNCGCSHKSAIEEARAALAAPVPAEGEREALADEIEQSNGLIKMCSVQGTMQLGIKKTAMIVAALRTQPPAVDVVAEGEREAIALCDWLLGFLENECALDPSCVSPADRTNCINAIKNTLEGRT